MQFPRRHLRTYQFASRENAESKNSSHIISRQSTKQMVEQRDDPVAENGRGERMIEEQNGEKDEEKCGEDEVGEEEEEGEEGKEEGGEKVKNFSLLA